MQSPPGLQQRLLRVVAHSQEGAPETAPPELEQAIAFGGGSLLLVEWK